ncbi:UDP-4-amino-4,6-dideoxy-N-acetyl-beta-L-altrosamine transaminase [Aliiglaciecola sp. CAU 1673]|uniref:UDP-4-amino-4, 6-dideoxy-N-acetyl-beta-L-altrosamine transaminase n=1 Tax=Aliiglaciecola sp. CAU 1673 TaxID=3032595 RepID=UPI0023DC0C78|nr:UDP-4-amino-4,6-dideoxy-N-acetyl-beta-L-altrosamine transaminase [Aliiglaciecola sp. CAU 1673]MDF2178301.1 UDP-4-amino-4,6-dideoxy-N-acetyl-beta-L-altrosamine transaminase [Aliiglaciecola sp. CAU 1673]
MIPYGRQDISEEDIAAVAEVLRSDFLTQGPTVPALETAICDMTGAGHAVACANGTAALHLACLAAGVSQGDMVWTSSLSFAASANCARYCGASIDFVDIDINTGNLCPKALADKLQNAGKKPKALVAVHFAGQPVDLKEISELCRQHGVILIEDASHALGATYEDSRIGDCRYSDFTTFSLHPVKIITSGEGGLVTTNNPEWAKKLQLYRSHGISKDIDDFEVASPGPWYYEMQTLGFNYRLTDIQAALALSQLKRLPEFIEKRNQLADHYRQALAGLPVVPLTASENRLSAYHLFVIRLAETSSINRDTLFHSLREKDIGCQVHYLPIHLMPYYRSLGFKKGDLPITEAFSEQVLSLPLYPTLTASQQDKVIQALQELLA